MQQLTSIHHTSRSAEYPQYTQDGAHIVFSVNEDDNALTATVEIMDTSGNDRHTIPASAPYIQPGGTVQVTRCRRFDVY
jgi:hypothetical protein